MSKSLINIDTKSIDDAKAASSILASQIIFNIKNTHWNRNISNNSRKFTTDIMMSSEQPCPEMEADQHQYTWFLGINGYQSTIPLTITCTNRKQEKIIVIVTPNNFCL